MPRRKAVQVTADDVHEQVRRIGAVSRDDQAALAMEYELYRAVLAAIAQGNLDGETARRLALTALQSQKFGFERTFT